MILILVPIWQRPEITKIWVSGMKWFLQDERVLCILSREDPFFKENLLAIRGFDYCYFENKPLGQKLNAGIEYALECFDFDYLMNLGSDDFIHTSVRELYAPVIAEGCKFFGLNKIYFFEKKTGRLGLTRAYLWGAGRMIHRSILERIRQKEGFLYKSEFARGLDCNSHDRIKELLGIDYKHLETKDFPYLVDIKVDFSINDFTLMQRFMDIVDFDIIRRNYPENLIKMLYD